jgi:hypothetical protein
MRLFALLLAAVLLSTPVFAKEAAWSAIKGGKGTACADGTPYQFYVKRGAKDKLVVFFNGGGACWSPETCNPKAERAVYLSSMAAPSNDPKNWKGIFDQTETKNPFVGWTMIAVSYCTADSHIGSRRVTYELAGQKFAIEHKGWNNAQAALRWTFKNYTAPKTVFVTGSSAGAIAAPFHVGTVAKQYPKARVTMLGDAAGAYRAAAIPAIFKSWGVEDISPTWMRALNGRPLNTETFFKINATAFPNVPQAQYSTAADDVQGMFLKLLGESETVEAAMRANLTELHAEIPSFRTYLAPGPSHTILQTPGFYGTRVEGMPLSQWVDDFAAGKPVEDVDCAKAPSGCTLPVGP